MDSSGQRGVPVHLSDEALRRQRRFAASVTGAYNAEALASIVPALDILSHAQRHVVNGVDFEGARRAIALFADLTRPLAPPPGVLEAITASLATLRQGLEQIRTQTRDLDVRDLLRRYQPHNWHDVSEQTSWEDLIDLAVDGIPTAWVPRAEVLDAVLESEVEDRYDVLTAHFGLILEDCTVALDEASGGTFGEHARLLQQAVACLRFDQYGGTQALATLVLDTLLGLLPSPGKGTRALLGQYPVNAEPTVGQLRFHVTMVALHPAFTPFFQSNGDPIPAVFNRHATVHSAGDAQYSARNALVALMLTVALVRELHEQRVEEDSAAA